MKPHCVPGNVVGSLGDCGSLQREKCGCVYLCVLVTMESSEGEDLAPDTLVVLPHDFAVMRKLVCRGVCVVTNSSCPS